MATTQDECDVVGFLKNRNEQITTQFARGSARRGPVRGAAFTRDAVSGKG
jgi:hypothetical protein